VFKILDLFCCEGGAGMGYSLAGFDVTGVDLEAKYAKRYPFKFNQADALEFLAANYQDYDAIHASPPCQAYSVTKSGHSKEYPKLIEITRDILNETGLPYILENVVGAPLREPALFCGRSFGLSAIDTDGTPLVMDRHRLFETNWGLVAPKHDKHDKSLQVAGSYGGARRDKKEAREIRKGGYVPSKEVQEKLLGITWASQYALYQSIPPVYTEYIGKQLIEYLRSKSV